MDCIEYADCCRWLHCFDCPHINKDATLVDKNEDAKIPAEDPRQPPKGRVGRYYTPSLFD